MVASRTWLLSGWTVLCVGLAWRALRDIPIAAVAATIAAFAFTALVARCSPQRTGARWAVYITALVANQTSAAVAGVLPLLPGHHLHQISPSVEHLTFAVLSACVALATFVLVRSWVSDGDRHRCFPRRARHSVSATVGFGSAVVVAYIAADAAAMGLWHAGRTLFGVETVPYPLAPGGPNDWALAAAKTSVAGAVEEPVYVGLIVLLWPRFRATTVIPLALFSSAARTVMHLYYAADSGALIPAVALVAMWCTVWSTASLLLVYLSRSLWPVIIGHGLLNVLMTTNGPYTDSADATVLVYVLVALLGLVLGTVLIGFMSVSRQLFGTPVRELPVLLRIDVLFHDIGYSVRSSNESCDGRAGMSGTMIRWVVSL